MRALVVLPTYNESANVLSLVERVLGQDPALEVLVVDDSSPDGTGDLVDEAAAVEPRLHLVRRAAKLGLGTAYLEGFRYGLDHGYDCVFTMDCDHSHDPDAIPSMGVAAARADLVIGSRYVEGGRILNWPLRRRALSRFANAYTRGLLRLRVRDCTSGYRCYRRELLEGSDPFAITASGYAFLEEMVWRASRAGFRIEEVPIVFRERRSGASKIDRSEIFRAAWHVLATALRELGPGRRRGARAAPSGASARRS